MDAARKRLPARRLRHQADYVRPPYAGSGFPYKGYCSVIGQVAVNYGLSVMQPYYFPFVRRSGPILEGFFDYRPRNEQEAVVTAISSDGGVTWTFTGMALGLNTYCPWDDTDPDNLNVSVPVLGVPKKTAYGSNANNAADNGLGHPVVLTVNNRQFLYQLNRANGFIDSSPLVVHQLPSVGVPGSLLALLPAKGYQSPLAPGNVPISGNYPTLQAPYKLTSGLIDPDAFIGALTVGGTTTVVYVSKNTSATADTDAGYTACPKTPLMRSTNSSNGSAHKADHDLITIRVGHHHGWYQSHRHRPHLPACYDPGATSSVHRWLGSGSLIRLASRQSPMFYGAQQLPRQRLGLGSTTSATRRPRTRHERGDLPVLDGIPCVTRDNPILSGGVALHGRGWGGRCQNQLVARVVPLRWRWPAYSRPRPPSWCCLRHAMILPPPDGTSAHSLCTSPATRGAHVSQCLGRCGLGEGQLRLKQAAADCCVCSDDGE